MTEKERQARRALKALYLEVDESIAQDVEQKLLDAIDELKELLSKDKSITDDKHE